MPRHLTDSRADFDQIALQKRGKFINQRLPVITRLVEGSELEVVGVSERIGGGGVDKEKGMKVKGTAATQSR